MSLSPLERAFLEKLATEKQGRMSYSLLDYARAIAHIEGLFDRGFIKHRRLGFREGIQITPEGRAYLSGEHHV